MNGYPGSKAASGLAERIIGQMPPHEIYIEACAGFAAVFRKKLPAKRTILIDANPATCNVLRSYLAASGGAASAEVLCEDALAWLPSCPAVQSSTTLVYFDAPYLPQTRRGGARLLYDAEMQEEDSHKHLLSVAKKLPCLVMVSHYSCTLYERALKRWRKVEIPAMTRGGQRTECVWCNFPLPAVLHDPRQAGGDFRARERIKRKRKRWAAKFAKMDGPERQAVALALVEADRSSVEAALRIPASESAMGTKDAG